jgi:hypothetical protein
MYKGYVKNGKRHHQGEFRYSDGSFYTGNWFENQMQG